MEDAREALVRRLRDAEALVKLIGNSSAFLRALEAVRIAARSDAAVLVTGETGTGKELVARAIHYISDRASEPFVAVNCGSLTDTLLEDELFGHERGAFTDAQQRRSGLIAQADRGTLFLDEVDTLTPRGQAALLRVLQDKVYRPLGSQREHQAQVRFVAATNMALSAAVDAGAFRVDLYYRLCVFTIALPPLRERPDDILRLAMHFIQKHCPDGIAAPPLSAAAQATLLAYTWPGNVREIENAMIRGVRFSEGAPIEVDHLGLPSTSGHGLAAAPAAGKFQMAKAEMIRNFERDYLQQLMQQADGNVTRAAKLAGKDRRDFGKLLKKHSLLGTKTRTSG